MLYAAVLGEVEHRFFVEAADLEIAFGDEDLIALAKYLQDLTEKYKKERPNF